MKCPNVGKQKCKGTLTEKVDEDGNYYYYCPSCGYTNIKKGKSKK